MVPKKKVVLLFVLLAIFLVMVLGGKFFIDAIFRGDEINEYVIQTLRDNTNAGNLDYLDELEARLAKENPLVMKLFFEYGDAIQERRDSFYQAIDARAEEVTTGIAALEKCIKIESEEHYTQLYEAVKKLWVSDDDDFGTQVLAKVSNYDALAQYEKDLEALRETYRHDCEKCKGTGHVTCDKCHGKVRGTCILCNGTGKMVYTWYEYGDWGEKSYTSSTCSSCKGSGKDDCGSCDHGQKDCISCASGNIYIYEDGKES